MQQRLAQAAQHPPIPVAPETAHQWLQPPLPALHVYPLGSRFDPVVAVTECIHSAPIEVENPAPQVAKYRVVLMDIAPEGVARRCRNPGFSHIRL